MQNKETYFFPNYSTITEALVDMVFANVFRQDLTRPGFALIDFGPGYSSEGLRESMVELKKVCNQKAGHAFGKQLDYQWMGRFDQQATTKFHRDNAPDQSFLMLGYEPSAIRSRLFMADYAQLIVGLGISEKTYFESYNPMYTEGEKALLPYTTAIKGFDNTHFQILFLNNSHSETATPGLFHKAEMIDENPVLPRIVNSMMLVLGSLSVPNHVAEEEERAFVQTQKFSRGS
jgi:hypothetical protein